MIYIHKQLITVDDVMENKEMVLVRRYGETIGSVTQLENKYLPTRIRAESSSFIGSIDTSVGRE